MASVVFNSYDNLVSMELKTRIIDSLHSKGVKFKYSDVEMNISNDAIGNKFLDIFIGKKFLRESIPISIATNTGGNLDVFAKSVSHSLLILLGANSVYEDTLRIIETNVQI